MKNCFYCKHFLSKDAFLRPCKRCNHIAGWAGNKLAKKGLRRPCHHCQLLIEETVSEDYCTNKEFWENRFKFKLKGAL
jgi:RNA polymerase subunit RPABC4/transcription elongation factor Spt4